MSQLERKHVLLETLVDELSFLGAEFPVLFLLFSLVLRDVVKAEFRDVVSIEGEESAMCIHKK